MPCTRSSSTATLIDLPERELEVQRHQAAQDERRKILVAAVASRPVLSSEIRMSGCAREPLDGRAALGPGQRRAGAGVDAAAKRDVLAGVGPGRIEHVRVLEAARSRFAAPFSNISVVPAGHVDAAHGAGTRDSRKSPLIGLSNRSTSSMKLGSGQRSLRSLLDLRLLGNDPQRVAEQRTVVSWPAEYRLAAIRTASMTSGIEPSGRSRSPGR